MHPDIEKAIELIDSKIHGLQRVKQTLLDEFGGEPAVNKQQTSLPFRRRLIVAKKPETRKEAIIKLLKEEGPLSRSEIINKSGIPQGTVATVLTDKDTFKSKDNKWYVAEDEQIQS